MSTTKEAKIELRIDQDLKSRIRKHAAKAGYKGRDFSVWARRVLDGEELHPNFEEVRGTKRG